MSGVSPDAIFRVQKKRPIRHDRLWLIDELSIAQIYMKGNDNALCVLVLLVFFYCLFLFG